MKKIMLSVALITIAMNGYSQSVTNSVCDSTLVYITKQLDNIEFGINGKNRFKLYPTENVYTFLRLDTATGRVAQVQWSQDSENEGSVIINDEDLSLGLSSGTFELYPTKNLFQFILLDKVTGRQWHIQWGMETTKRWIRRIY